ncbi:MAG: SH3 domain-containing protein [Romboutsia sp.]
MKKPTKIIITVVVIIGSITAIGGFIVKSKLDESKSILNEAKNQTTKVKKGDLKVTVSGSGTVVQKNQDSDNLDLQVEIDELDIDKVKANQSVEIQLDAFPDEVFYGTVTEVAPQGTVVNGVSNFMINVSMPNSIKEVGKINKDGEIRKGQSDDYMSIAKIEKGDTIEILDKDGDYYKVATKDNEQGWIEESYITDKKIKSNQTGTVNKDVVNVKAKTSNDSDTIVKLIKGDSVEIREENDDWYKVKLSNNKEGYIETKNINTQKIKSGMNASASILVEQKENVLYVPIESVNKENIDDYYVVLPNDGKEKDINVGVHNEDYIEVIDGLNEGDKIKLPEKEVKLPQSPFGMMPSNMSN